MEDYRIRRLRPNVPGQDAAAALVNKIQASLAPIRVGGKGMLGGGGGIGDDDSMKGSSRDIQKAPRVDVNVSMLPLRATFNANLAVNLNGQVIARVLMPIMYQMLTKAARGTGASNSGGAGRVR